MGPHPAVAEVRLAVRRGLADLPPGSLVLAACSGGADSLCLAAALAWEAPRSGLRAGAVTVDHGLQPGSAEVARRAAAALRGLGLDPVAQVRAVVPGPAGQGGPEAAARDARYAALDQAADQAGAAAVLLGHTRDDQAETVLLGLARGSGPRSLAGMPPRRGVFRRPLLGLRRPVMAEACAALGLEPWQDPQNADAAYARARVRHQALPALAAALGPGVAEALARTAAQLRADAEVLDELARAEAGRLREPGPAATESSGPGSSGPGSSGPGSSWPVPPLAALPPAIRSRVLRLGAIEAGCPAGRLTAGHVGALDRLVTGWHGQRWADLPGGIRARRRYDKLLFIPPAGGSGAGVRGYPPGRRCVPPGGAAEAARPRLVLPEDASGRE
ncbi:MAG TPA: tRNA lysidine(34) synthetase TilS [Streptosporangiaceae bacterium]|nr:tRNA lysidine(34) synthetase TilS [Streptosporangiaceae bacterium]